MSHALIVLQNSLFSFNKILFLKYSDKGIKICKNIQILKGQQKKEIFPIQLNC